MQSILHLRQSEIKALQHYVKHSKQGKHVFRAVIILLLNILEISQISELFGLPIRTIYARINRFKMYKITSFKDKKRSGRPSSLNHHQKNLLLKWITESPEKHGYINTNWTCELLAKHLFLLENVLVSPETIRRTLQKHGYRRKKPRHCVKSPDPKREEKLAQIEAKKNNLKPDEVMVYLDEADFNLFSDLRNCWQQKGTQLAVETPRKNQKVYGFGSLDAHTKKLVYAVKNRKRSVEFIAFLNQLMMAYPNKKLNIVLDNFIIHKSQKTQNFVKLHQDRLNFLPLPTYSPQDNPIERLWGTVKGWINSNWLYNDKWKLKKAAHEGLRLYQTKWWRGEVA